MVLMTSSDALGGHHHLQLHLGQQIDVVLLAAVDLFVAFLAAVAADFGDRHAVDADALQRFLDFVQLERLDDRFDFFHMVTPSALEDISFLAVHAEIEPSHLLFLGDAQADRGIADLQDDERADDGQHPGDRDADQPG